LLPLLSPLPLSAGFGAAFFGGGLEQAMMAAGVESVKKTARIPRRCVNIGGPPCEPTATSRSKGDAYLHVGFDREFAWKNSLRLDLSPDLLTEF
jgi:hypothetical protein